MSSYAAHMSEHRRLSALIVLRAMPEPVNDSIIFDHVKRSGILGDREMLRDDLRWLHLRGLVALEELGDLLICAITAQGEQVSHGKLRVEGVRRPSRPAL